MTDETRRMMLYDAQKKNVGVAYLFWFFVGFFGAHRFYLGRNGSAIAQLVLCVTGVLTTPFFIGAVILGGLAIWILLDAFLIPGIAREQNVELAARS